MKKLLSILFAAVLATTVLCSTVSACPYGHQSTYLVTTCEHRYENAPSAACPAAGRPYWDDDHPVGCKMILIQCHTTSKCSYAGCSYNSSIGTHHCSTYHTGVTYQAMVCNYTSVRCPHLR